MSIMPRLRRISRRIRALQRGFGSPSLFEWKKIADPFLMPPGEYVPDTGKKLLWLTFNRRRGEDILLTLVCGDGDHGGERAGSANQTGDAIPLCFRQRMAEQNEIEIACEKVIDGLFHRACRHYNVTRRLKEQLATVQQLRIAAD